MIALGERALDATFIFLFIDDVNLTDFIFFLLSDLYFTSFAAPLAARKHNVISMGECVLFFFSQLIAANMLPNGERF